MLGLAAWLPRRSGKSLRSLLPIGLPGAAGAILVVVVLGIWNTGLLADGNSGCPRFLFAALVPIVLAPVTLGMNRHR